MILPYTEVEKMQKKCKTYAYANCLRQGASGLSVSLSWRKKLTLSGSSATAPVSQGETCLLPSQKVALLTSTLLVHSQPGESPDDGLFKDTWELLNVFSATELFSGNLEQKHLNFALQFSTQATCSSMQWLCPLAVTRPAASPWMALSLP